MIILFRDSIRESLNDYFMIKLVFYFVRERHITDYRFSNLVNFIVTIFIN